MLFVQTECSNVNEHVRKLFLNQVLSSEVISAVAAATTF